jgi:hypothetical protein
VARQRTSLGQDECDRRLFQAQTKGTSIKPNRLQWRNSRWAAARQGNARRGEARQRKVRHDEDKDGENACIPSLSANAGKGGRWVVSKDG